MRASCYASPLAYVQCFVPHRCFCVLCLYSFYLLPAISKEQLSFQSVNKKGGRHVQNRSTPGYTNNFFTYPSALPTGGSELLETQQCLQGVGTSSASRNWSFRTTSPTLPVFTVDEGSSNMR